MKKRSIRILFCFLAVILLLAGCSASELPASEVNKPSASELVSSEGWTAFDAYTFTDDFSVIAFSRRNNTITNAEGKELHWPVNSHGDRIYPPDGTMGIYHCDTSSMEANILVPYSKSFTVQSDASGLDYSAEFYVMFNKDNFWITEMRVFGQFEGKLTLSDNYTMELEGTHLRLQVFFEVHEEEGRNLAIGKYLYALEAEEGENTKIRLEGDELIAEGIQGEYTVTKYEYVGENSDRQEIYTKKRW